MRVFFCIAGLIFLATLGCGAGASSTLAGTVTFNGQPLKKGTVSLTPLGSDGGMAGAMIVDGKFTVPNLKPGKYTVHIAREPDGPVILPNSPEAQRTMTPEEIRRMTAAFPDDLAGNDVVVEIQPGGQAKDFPLTSASTRR